MTTSDERIERAICLLELAIKAREVGELHRADELTRLATESYWQAGRYRAGDSAELNPASCNRRNAALFALLRSWELA